jgi:serine/threonine protein kinase
VLLDAHGWAYLADFGIASSAGDSSTTAAGTLVGAPAYMAPERVRGLKSGPESDFWSLGVTIYAAVEGIVPFHRDDPLACMTSVLMDEPPAPARAGPLAPLLTRLLDKDPAGRPSADEIATALGGAALASATVPLEAPAPAPTQVIPPPVAPARRHRRAPMAVGAFGTAAAVAALLFMLRPTAPPSTHTPAAPTQSVVTSTAQRIAPVEVTSKAAPTTTTDTTTTTSSTTTTTTTTTTVPPTTTTTAVTTTTTTTPPAAATTTAAQETSAVSPTS